MLKISILAVATLLALPAYCQIINPAPYCIAGYDDAGGTDDVSHFISNVTFATLNNTSGDTQFAAPHYVYYNNVAAPNVEVGHTYTLSVSHDPVPSSIQYVVAFIDFNQNSNFEDSGERVLQQTEMTYSITNPSLIEVTIPATATLGLTRMRVMVIEDDDYSSTHVNAPSCTADSSGYLDWGETEDYNVNITASDGVENIVNDDDHFLYPNPTKGTVFVDGSFFGANLTIFDLEGRVVQQSTVVSAHLDINSLAPGVYFVKVTRKGVVNYQSLIINP